jgi:hypothetical protein
MALPTFQQWLMERGKRTSLGIYPPLYGSGQLPPLAHAPTSAGHLNSFATIHGDEHPELLSKEIRKAAKNYKKNKHKNDGEDKLKKLGL